MRTSQGMELPSTPTDNSAMAVVWRVEERWNLLATIMPMPQPSAARVTASRPSAGIAVQGFRGNGTHRDGLFCWKPIIPGG